MPVDKFGRNGDRTTTVYTEINIANLTNSLLRSDGGNELLILIVILLKMYQIRCQIKMLQPRIM